MKEKVWFIKKSGNPLKVYCNMASKKIAVT